MEHLLRAQSESQSFAFWCVSDVLAQAKQSGLEPQVPRLFEQAFRSVSLSLVGLFSASSSLALFLHGKRRELYFSHLPPHSSESHKTHLLSSSLRDLWRS